MSALTDLVGSDDFRKATARWGPTFQDVVEGYEQWRLGFGDDATLRAHVQLKMVELATVIRDIEEQARRDVGS